MSQTTHGQLPRVPVSATDVAGVIAALNDLLDVVRGVDEVERKTFDVTAGDYPLVITTRVKNVGGVTAVGAWNLDTTTSAAYVRGVAWSRGDSAGELKINGLENLTSGTRYRVTLRIEGER